MTRSTVSAFLLGLAIVVGTMSDTTAQRLVATAGGYRVLSADFHIHTSFGSDGTLTPLGVVVEAQRQGLDAIAMTGHNNVLESKIGRWLVRWLGGVTVLRGEEIVAPAFHLIAVGIDQRVDFRQSAADAIDAVHQQGGVAIAAHPGPEYSPGFSDAAVAKLDGAEICHPMVYGRRQAQGDLETFASRAHMAAIGSSDYHGFGPLGGCRTFVFAHDNTEAAIVEAIRAHRTVTFGVGGKAYGDPEFVRLAEAAGVRQRLPKNDRGSGADWLSRIAGVIGLGSLVLGQTLQQSRRKKSYDH